MSVSLRPNQRWSLDFVSDTFGACRKFRILERVAFYQIHIFIPKGEAAFAQQNAFTFGDEFNSTQHALAVNDDCCRKNLCLPLGRFGLAKSPAGQRVPYTNISGARVARELDARIRIYGRPACIICGQRDRVHQQGRSEEGQRKQRRVALHRSRQATAERLHRELQGKSAALSSMKSPVG